MAPLVKRLQRAPGIRCQVCVTGQHREMLDQVLTLFEVEPDADLDIMRPGQDLAGLTARLIEGLDRLLAERVDHASNARFLERLIELERKVDQILQSGKHR